MKKTAIMSTIAMLIVALCASIVRPQTVPDLTGTWKANLSKSQFAGGSPKELVFKFDQKGSSITESFVTVNDRGERANSFKYTTDGKEASNTFYNRPVRVTAKWEGPALIVKVAVENRPTGVRKITLSPDGKLMTIAASLHASNGDITNKETWILEKQ